MALDLRLGDSPLPSEEVMFWIYHLENPCGVYESERRGSVMRYVPEAMKCLNKIDEDHPAKKALELSILSAKQKYDL